jgi:3-dehydroquinate synthase
MQKKKIRFTSTSVDYYFEGSFSILKTIVDQKNAVLITDENIFEYYSRKLKGWKIIVLKPGEEYKVQATVDNVINQLIALDSDRTTTLVGVGGGVITDLTGYIASVFMRGIRFGFVPTTLLCFVDASIGGKNGIDVGVFKNMVGTIRQPAFILHDLNFLRSLPDHEWYNGFSEIIKHACIKDAQMFRQLEKNSTQFYQNNLAELGKLIQRNAMLKSKIVQIDEYEHGDRKLLNFGHTLGHALENQYWLSHGQAISIGMAYASKLSQQLLDFQYADRIIALLENYNLLTFTQFKKEKVIQVLKNDKKKEPGSINFILLERIGKAAIRKISIDEIYKSL